MFTDETVPQVIVLVTEIPSAVMLAVQAPPTPVTLLTVIIPKAVKLPTLTTKRPEVTVLVTNVPAALNVPETVTPRAVTVFETDILRAERVAAVIVFVAIIPPALRLLVTVIAIAVTV